MLNFILEKLENGNVFLTGSAGVGKSYLTKQIIDYYNSDFKYVITLGSTGISAVALNGITLHSFFKIGICKTYDELKKLDFSQKNEVKELKKILSRVELIIIDEISMISAEVFDLINYRLDSCGFGGKILVVGDFLQLEPIMKKEEKEKKSLLYSGHYAFNSLAWDKLNFTIIEIIGSKRTLDRNFYEILSNLRVGKVDKNCLDFIQNHLKGSFNDDFTTIFGTNIKVNNYNFYKLNELKTELKTAKSKLDIYDENADFNEISRWKNAINQNEIFEFKIGAKVIFTSNKSGEFYNGEQGIISDFGTNESGEIMKILIKKSNGNSIFLERQRFDLNEICVQDDEVVTTTIATFLQFPIKLAYAITIHKSQGMSIERLNCDITDIFAKGQLYVALSRAIDPAFLGIFYNGKNLQNHIEKATKIDSLVEKFYQENEILKLNHY